MSKSRTLDFILGMSEDEIGESYPFGVVIDKKSKDVGRWLPADKPKPDKDSESEEEALGRRSLRQLIQEKRARQIKPRFLANNSTYVTPCRYCNGLGRIEGEPCLACGQTGAADVNEPPGYTTNPAAAMPGEPEPIEANVQRLQSAEASARYRVDHLEQENRAALRSGVARLREKAIEYIKQGVDANAALDMAMEEIRRDKAA